MTGTGARGGREAEARTGEPRTGEKVTAVSPANIAFVKYWGARDPERAVPLNPSISMTLSRCVSRCTVELRPAGAADEVLLAPAMRPAPEPFAAPVRAQLERVRRWAGRKEGLRVATRNSFPSDAGLASSASGFSALTLATARALGRDPDREDRAELATLTRRSGSGSAARSLLGGFVEWDVSESGVTRLRRLAGPDDWELRDVIALVETEPKPVSSREGHRRAHTSPYLSRRLELLPERLRRVRAAIADRDPAALGPVVEEEAVDLHLIAMSSRPPIFYWRPGTLRVLEEVRSLRRDRVGAWATMDAGANVHVLCVPEEEEEVAERLAALDEVVRTLRDRTGAGPRWDDEHLL